MKLTLVSGTLYKSIFILLPLCWVISACSESSEGRRDIVTNENIEADLGKIKEEKGTVQARLVVANPTSSVLTPVQAYTRCTCLKAKVDRNPVAPGENVLIELDYNPAYKEGIIMEEVQVIFADSDYLMSLVVKGDVLPCKHPVTDYAAYDFGSGLYISQEVVPFGKLQPGESGSVYVSLASDKKRPIEVTFDSPSKNIHMIQSKRLEKEGRDTLQLGFTMPKDASPGDTLLLPVGVLVNGKHQEKPLIVKAIARGTPQSNEE